MGNPTQAIYPGLTNVRFLLACFVLYAVAGLCWLPVVYLQMRMRDDCVAALSNGQPLAPRYWRDARTWFWLGVPAFLAMLAVLFLMVARPAF